MSQYNEFAGVYSLLLTPFNWDRTIDYKCYEEYVAWQAAYKPQHLFAVCGSSEMMELTQEERIKCAGLAVKAGLDKEEAWKAITINPAVQTGIGDRVGSIEPGKDADIVIWDADPLSAIGGQSYITVIDGKVIYKAD